MKDDMLAIGKIHTFLKSWLSCYQNSEANYGSYSVLLKLWWCSAELKHDIS